MNFPVEVRGLRKSFRRQEILHGIDLSIPAKSVFALLGRNGAGKSTTLRLLLGLLSADAGEIRLLGKPMPAARNEILAEVGSMIEMPSLYDNLTARENLSIDARLRGLDARAIAVALEVVELADDGKPVRDYSLGMKQRLSLALAVLGKPRLLLLDEPTNGLDPMGIADMRALLRDLPERLDTTVLLSTHLLSEVEQLASDVAILEAGELRYSGSLGNLRRDRTRVLRLSAADVMALERELRAMNLPVVMDSEQRTLQVPIQDEDDAAMLIRHIVEHGHALHHAALEQARLEEIYFEMIGRTEAAA